MSAPCPIPYCIKQGETRRTLYTVFQLDGDIQNLTSAVIELQVKPNIGDPDEDILVSRITPTEIVISDQTVDGDTEGQFIINWDPDDTKDLEAGQYVYDIVITLLSGERIYAVDPSPFTILLVVNQA